VDYLLKNRHNYTVFRELKEEESVSHELIKGKADNILDFYTYLIENSKLKDFTNKLLSSEKEILKVMEDSISSNNASKDEIIEFKNIIEKENESISIDLSKINSLNIEDNSVKDFLSEKMNKTKTKKRQFN